VAPQGTPPRDVLGLAALGHGVFDGWRAAALEHLENDALGGGSNARNAGETSARAYKRRQGLFERHDCGGRALVAEHARLRRLRVRQVAKQSAHDCVDVGKPAERVG
jgi:hypothetical protein